MLKGLQMLDVTTNPNINCISGGANSTATTTTSISLEDDTDPLLDNDWLHEHNLDILFDLFEEEMGTSAKASGFQETNFNNSSAFFGSSPVTSYLFGTSPSLASAIDLYDLLYFEHQQPIMNNTTTTSSTTNTTITTNNQLHHYYYHSSSMTAPTINNSTTTNIHNANIYNNSKLTTTTKNSSTRHKGQNVSTNHITNSITNALKIKKRLKRSQNEGISLLARPNLGNTTNVRSCNTSTSTSSSSSNNNNSNFICSNNVNNNIDKTSTKLTNLKNNINCSGGIGINVANQSHQLGQNEQHYQNHSHCITGLAVIREHAYAAFPQLK